MLGSIYLKISTLYGHTSFWLPKSINLIFHESSFFLEIDSVSSVVKADICSLFLRIVPYKNYTIFYALHDLTFCHLSTSTFVWDLKVLNWVRFWMSQYNFWIRFCSFPKIWNITFNIVLSTIYCRLLPK